ncbi:fumarylacetoacetate hydrolase family protein [Nocardioides endophyticus]|uniref:Fumarylacetoacetate hydrolase family protein n=1 Tax=Nocardioides endophyticus TaxID=1353775 RepID=A0ABP8YZL6_9ACTN
MRFVSFRSGADEARLGVLEESRIHVLHPGSTLLGLLGDDGERLHEAGAAALRDPYDVLDLDETRLLPAVPAPPTVRDFMTFERHVEGTAKLAGPDGRVPAEWYEFPTFYFTNPYAVIGPHDDVPVPPGCTLFDLELEVAAVIGREGRDVRAEDAAGHIAGFCLLNDWSARDLQLTEMQIRLGPAKGKDTSLSLGGVFVTADELAPHRSGTAYDLEMTATINGEVLGTDKWSSMHFSYEEMVAHASRGTVVRPGDVLGSGTSGGGCLAELWGREGFDAHAPLGPGDVVTIAVEGLDSMTSRIVAYSDRGR